MRDLAPLISIPTTDLSASGSLVLEARRSLAPEILGGLGGLIVPGGRLYCVDTANCFDPYAFSAQARRHGMAPEQVLDRVFVTRCFTIHQFEGVVAQMLPQVAQQRDPVAVLGAENLFLEESLSVAERARVLGRIMAALTALAATGMPLLLTHDLPPKPAPWWRPLLDFGAARGRLKQDANAQWMIQMTRYSHGQNRPDVQHVPDGGDGGLASVPPGPSG